jgi:DNA mismatch repair protein MSH3
MCEIVFHQTKGANKIFRAPSTNKFTSSINMTRRRRIISRVSQQEDSDSDNESHDDEQEQVKATPPPRVNKRVIRTRSAKKSVRVDSDEEEERPKKRTRKNKKEDDDFVPADEESDEDMQEVVPEEISEEEHSEEEQVVKPKSTRKRASTSNKKKSPSNKKKQTKTKKKSDKEMSDDDEEEESDKPDKKKNKKATVDPSEKFQFDPRVYMYSPGTKVAIEDEQKHKWFVRKLLAHSLKDSTEEEEVAADADGDHGSDEEETTSKKKKKTNSKSKKKATPKKTSSSSKPKYTPLEQQVLKIKKEYPGVCLFVEVGYRFKLYGDDALNASKVLGIIAYSASNFMCASIPTQRLSYHLRRMINAGYKCGVVRQQETAALKAAATDSSKKSAPFSRDLENMYSASTLIGEDIGELDENPCSHLMVLHEKSNDKNVEISIVAVDVSTGDVFYDGPFTDTQMRRELETRLCKIQPVELLIPDTVTKETERIIREGSYRQHQSAPRIEKVKTLSIESDQMKQKLAKFWRGTEDDEDEDMDSEQDDSEELKSFLLLHDDVLQCFYHLIHFLKDFKLASILTLSSSKLQSLDNMGKMNLNSITLKNLEILQNSVDGSVRGTLYSILDRSRTKFGGRQLKKWIAHPLANIVDIKDRLDVIQEIHDSDATCLQTMLDLMHNLPDLEKTIMRIHYQRVTPKEFLRSLLAFQKIFENIPKESEWKSELQEGGLLYRTFAKIPTHLLEFVQSFTDSFSHKAAEDGVKSALFIKQSKTGKFPEIAEYYKQVQDAKKKIDGELIRAQKKLEKPNLKYKLNWKNYKYVLEVPVAVAKNAPKEWMKLGQTKALVRYTTPLIEEQVKIIALYEDKLDIESAKAWKELLKQFSEGYNSLKLLIEQIAVLDCLNSLAEVSKMPGYTKADYVPDEEERVLEIREGRHPILETIMTDSEFVPNGIEMSYSKDRVYVLTGPNMAGKSVFMKTISLIVLMAQIGCYVPADHCRMSVFDQIFTRMGASDDISRGHSTFFVELSEASEILHNATKKSLVLLDEIGRGTSTYDGYAIAHAILTRLIEKVHSFTLFVTHYPLITHLERVHKCVSNYHMAFSSLEDDNEEQGEIGEKNIKFLYKLSAGVAEKSYGINVAKLAGIHPDIIERAQTISKESEQKTQMRITENNFTQLMKLLEENTTNNKQVIIDCQEAILQLSPLFS